MKKVNNSINIKLYDMYIEYLYAKFDFGTPNYDFLLEVDHKLEGELYE